MITKERKFKLVNYCGHCGTEHKTIREATECCGGFQEQAFECRHCKKQFVRKKNKDDCCHKCQEDDSDGQV